MPIDVKLNPQKSFQFVRAITNIVANETKIKSQPQLERTREAAKKAMPSPKEIRNAAAKSNIKLQSVFTPQDRFIDLMI